jgi:hypothetical protein
MAEIDLDFKLDDADKPSPMGKHRAEPELVGSTSEGPPSGMAPQLTRPAAALELDKLDLSFDPDRSTFEDPTPSVLDGQWTMPRPSSTWPRRIRKGRRRRRAGDPAGSAPRGRRPAEDRSQDAARKAGLTRLLK